MPVLRKQHMQSELKNKMCPTPRDHLTH